MQKNKAKNEQDKSSAASNDAKKNRSGSLFKPSPRAVKAQNSARTRAVAKSYSILASAPVLKANHKSCAELGEAREFRTATGIELVYHSRKHTRLSDGVLRCEWFSSKRTRKRPTVSAMIDCQGKPRAFEYLQQLSASMGKNEDFAIGEKGFKRQLSDNGYLYGFASGRCVVEVRTVHLPPGTEASAARVIAEWMRNYQG
jgi:hypothetical protein